MKTSEVFITRRAGPPGSGGGGMSNKRDEFKAELDALLRKHGAVIAITPSEFWADVMNATVRFRDSGNTDICLGEYYDGSGDEE